MRHYLRASESHTGSKYRRLEPKRSPRKFATFGAAYFGARRSAGDGGVCEFPGCRPADSSSSGFQAGNCRPSRQERGSRYRLISVSGLQSGTCSADGELNAVEAPIRVADPRTFLALNSNWLPALAILRLPIGDTAAQQRL